MAVNLNVVFHGMFLFWPRETEVLALAPDVPGHKQGTHGHVYKIGSWANASDISQSRMPMRLNIASHSTYWVGADRAAGLAISASKAKLSEPNPAEAYCTIALPFPDDIVGLRSAPSDWVTFGDKHDAVTQYGRNLPLVNVFVYRLASIQSHDGVNLHVFADPGDMSGENHFHFYGSLWKEHFDITLALAKGHENDQVKPDSQAGNRVTGMCAEDTKGWHEGASGSIEGRPANCMAVFLEP